MDRLWTLDPRAEWSVLAAPAHGRDAAEELGDGLQGPGSRLVRRALDPLRRRLEALGEAASIRQAEALVRWAEDQPTYAALCTTDRIDGRRRLRDDVVWGGFDGLEPQVMQVRRPIVRRGRLVFETLQHPVPPGSWGAAADLMHALSSGVGQSAARNIARQGKLEPWLDTLESAGVVGWHDEPPVPSEVRGSDVWFVGHNCAVVSDGRTRVLVDPWLRPWRDTDHPDYRPLRAVDVGSVDAIAITHAHGDHFHLGTLLQFPRDTPIYIPAVDRPSILSPSLARHLEQVGFTQVRPVRWWEEHRIGDVRLQILPFYGEQGSSLGAIDPHLRNQGNTYIVRTERVSAAFLADTGRDFAGDMQQVLWQARRRWGPVDMVWGGMRGFRICPLLLPRTSIDALWVNVPLDLMSVRQRLMNDGVDLMGCAEAAGARFVVPYADGGAPWFHREGMGPAYAGYPEYPGESEAVRHNSDDLRQAPFPERLIDWAQELANGAEPLVEPLILRPGDLVEWSPDGPRIGQVEGFAWPFDTDSDSDPAE